MTGEPPEDAGGGRLEGVGSVRALGTDRLCDLVAATWRASGWHVESTARDGTEGVFLATRDDCDGPDERRLILVLDVDSRPSAPAVRRAVELKRRHDADRTVVVSGVEFGSGAVAVADAYGVDLVGPTELERALEDTTDHGTDRVS